MVNNTAFYEKGFQLELPITSIVEEYKAGKVNTVMQLRYSNDPVIRLNPPEVKTGKNGKAKDEADRAEEVLRHKT